MRDPAAPSRRGLLGLAASTLAWPNPDRAVLAAPARGGESAVRYRGSTPHLLRGTVAGALWKGVTKGAGLSQAARRANFTNLQAAIDYAGSNRKFFELEPGRYQIEGGALNVRTDNFVWRGSRDSHIEQFGLNMPVLILGNTDNVTAIEGPDIRGVGLGYGVPQVGQTSANALQTHDVWFAIIENVEVECDWTGSAWINPPYRGFYAAAGADGQFWFSNIVRNLKIKGAQHCLMELKAVGTGNVYENIYLSNGTNAGGETMLPLTGPALWVSSFRVGHTGDQWTQLNIEWTKANIMARFENARPVGIRGFHLEGNCSSGDDPAVVFAVSQNTQLNIDNMDLTNHRFLAAKDMTPGTTGAVFMSYGAAQFYVRGLAFYQYTANQIDQPWLMFRQAPNLTRPEARMSARVEGLDVVRVRGATLGDFAWSDNTPAADAPLPDRQTVFTHHDMFDIHEGAVLGGGGQAPSNGLDRDFTVYGQHRHIRLIYKAALTAARTVVLASGSKSAGEGSSATTPAGTVATVIRMAGAASGGDVTVRNLTPGGALLATVPAAGRHHFQFDGTNWAPIT